MSPNQPPAAFFTGLFETHLHVRNLERSMKFYEKILGLELGMKELARRVAFYWIGGQGKSALGLWEKQPWVSDRIAGDQIINQHFAFEIDLADPRKSQPWNLIARGFGPGTFGYPGFRFPHLKKYRISHFLVPETTLHCPQRSFFLACLANRYLLPQNNI